MGRNDSTPTSEQLQDLLLESPGFTEFLLELTTIAASLLGGVSPLLCAITVERAGTPATVASSTEAARRLDEQQYTFDDGPCLTALRRQHPVLIPDLSADQRWSRYAQAVEKYGVRSVFAVPIPTSNSSGAALNCYSTEAGAFDPQTVSAITEHAASISKILQLAMRLYPAEPYPEHLRAALASRAVVDAAVALIMLQNRCGRDTALRILQLAAHDSNERLLVIARDILKQGLGPSAQPGSTDSPTPGIEDSP